MTAYVRRWSMGQPLAGSHCATQESMTRLVTSVAHTSGLQQSLQHQARPCHGDTWKGKGQCCQHPILWLSAPYQQPDSSNQSI